MLMKDKEPSTASEQQFEDKAKSQKSEAIVNAILIGFLAGIIIWSVAVNSVGLVTLIPLYLIYRLLKKPQEDAASDE